MCVTSIRIISLVVSIAVCTGVHHQTHNIYDENSESSINIMLDPSLVDKIHKEIDTEIPESLNENHPRDLNKLKGKYSDNNLENDNQDSMSKLNNSDDLEHVLELKDSDNDQENMPNLQVVLDSSVFVRGALRNIFEKLLTNPEALIETPVADLEKADIIARVSLTKTSKTLEAMAELQASNAVQQAIAELQASNVIRQAIAELQSSNAVQIALTEIQNSHVVRQVIRAMQPCTAVNERLAEGLNEIQMIMAEGLKTVQKAMAEDPKAQIAMAGLQVLNAVQKASNDVQETMEEFMALNAVEEAIAEDQAAAKFQKTMTAETAASYLQDDMGELDNLEAIPVTMVKRESDHAVEAIVEFQDSYVNQETGEDARIAAADTEAIKQKIFEANPPADGQEMLSEVLTNDSVETADVEVQATNTHDMTSEQPNPEGIDDSE